jgi:hypothetical protein
MWIADLQVTLVSLLDVVKLQVETGVLKTRMVNVRELTGGSGT